MPSYLLHLLTAKGPDRVHSPFVFDLYFHTLRGKYTHPSFALIETSHKNDSFNSDKIIGQSIFKIINKQKPAQVLLISDYSVKLYDYIKTSRKSTKVDCILGTKINHSLLSKNKDIQFHKSLNDIKDFSKYDLIISDTITTEFTPLPLDIYRCPKILITNIKTNKMANKNWLHSDSLDHNIKIDFFHFGISTVRKHQKKEYFKLRL